MNPVIDRAICVQSTVLVRPHPPRTTLQSEKLQGERGLTSRTKTALLSGGEGVELPGSDEDHVYTVSDRRSPSEGWGSDFDFHPGLGYLLYSDGVKGLRTVLVVDPSKRHRTPGKGVATPLLLFQP